MRTITVMQVFDSMGIKPEPAVSWSVGSRVASMYVNEHGEQPPKDNRPKTNGGGTHCFAIYPEFWRKRIEAVIRSVTDEAARQTDLFA
jgi:hypothetical protein